MSDLTEQVIPPAWYVDRLNALPARRGLPRLTKLDPLAMQLWHLATAPIPQPLLITVTTV